ncbi:hypothetical protein OC861_003797 [Tilletia horrida]|nr:hypothetical protein OC861_003797 [Tilletia horrida]
MDTLQTPSQEQPMQQPPKSPLLQELPPEPVAAPQVQQQQAQQQQQHQDPPSISSESHSDLTSISLEDDSDKHALPPSRPSITTTTTLDASQHTLNSSGTPSGTHSPYEVFAAEDPANPASLSSLPVILGIAVVDFNHLVGPQIEFAHPNSLLDDPDLSTNLPFLALPDGSHLSDEDFCYFHIYAPNLSPSTIFGISCNRQIASDALVRKGAEVTRSTVQKAVVVLAKEPVFGPIREKLGIVTRAFFAQGDLADINILIDFHATLEAGLQSGGFSTDRESALYMGTSLRELIHKWKFRTLVLVKLLLLQRNIMFYGYPIEDLCTQQYSLVSLIPGLLASLQDAGLPTLDSRTSTRVKAESLRTSDRKSLLRYLGLPLNLFGKDSFFQPYLPLQQIDLLKGSTYLVGTSNSIYRQQKDCGIDVIVDLEHSSLEFLNPTAQKLSALTAADRKWISEVENLVTSTWNPSDPTRPADMGYEGSDDHLRAKFEEYMCALLASVKHYQFDSAAGKGDAALAGASASSTQAFGPDFLEAFMKTKAFPSWNASTDPMIFDIIDHRHPCDGKTSALEDVGLRLAAGLSDMHIEENLAPARQAIGSAIQVGGANLYKFASGLRSEVVRLREQHLNNSNNAAGNSQGGEKGSGATDASSPSLSAASAAAASDKRASLSSSKRSSSSNPLSPSFLSGFRISSSSSSAATTTTTNATSASSSSTPAANGMVGGAGEAGPGAKNGDGQQTQFADVAAQTADRAAQAAAQAGTQMRAALGTFGNFLASKQRSWSTSAPSGQAGNGSNINTNTTTSEHTHADKDANDSAAAAAAAGGKTSPTLVAGGNVGANLASGWASLVSSARGAVAGATGHIAGNSNGSTSSASASGADAAAAASEETQAAPPSVPAKTAELPSIPTGEENSAAAAAAGVSAAGAGKQAVKNTYPPQPYPTQPAAMTTTTQPTPTSSSYEGPTSSAPQE